MSGLLNDGDSAALCSNAMGAMQYIEERMCCPSVLYRPQLFPDGDMWCALYRDAKADDLQMGFAAFGATPKEAMQNFDIAWRTQKAGGNE